jgi:hypothetical protein
VRLPSTGCADAGGLSTRPVVASMLAPFTMRYMPPRVDSGSAGVNGGQPAVGACRSTAADHPRRRLGRTATTARNRAANPATMSINAGERRREKRAVVMSERVSSRWIACQSGKRPAACHNSGQQLDPQAFAGKRDDGAAKRSCLDQDAWDEAGRLVSLRAGVEASRPRPTASRAVNTRIASPRLRNR